MHIELQITGGFLGAAVRRYAIESPDVPLTLTQLLEEVDFFSLTLQPPRQRPDLQTYRIAAEDGMRSNTIEFDDATITDSLDRLIASIQDAAWSDE